MSRAHKRGPEGLRPRAASMPAWGTVAAVVLVALMLVALPGRQPVLFFLAAATFIGGAWYFDNRFGDRRPRSAPLPLADPDGGASSTPTSPAAPTASVSVFDQPPAELVAERDRLVGELEAGRHDDALDPDDDARFAAFQRLQELEREISRFGV